MDRRFIRSAMRAQRRMLTPSQRAFSSFDLLRNLRTQIWYLRAQSIAAYLSNDGEINLAPVIDDCLTRNKLITLPCVKSEMGKMQLKVWQPTDSLISNRYGILEPTSGKLRPLFAHSVVFTPLVAFDSKGTRIGMGGGYYDRLLTPSSSAAPENRPLIVGVAYAFQQLEDLEAEDWDVPLDAVVTDQEVIRISARLRAPTESIEHLT
jgi:5-formyltetrahydrofolate cyclo-ligase